MFHFNRNNRKIKVLRTQVEEFEENIRQWARILEQEEGVKKEQR